jgi:hypothetical protein
VLARTNGAASPRLQELSREIKAWPDDGGFGRENFKNLQPEYRKAGAVKADPDLGRVIETRFVEQALKELK